MRMVSDMKDMVKYHGYQISEINNMTPFDYQAIKLLLAQDMQKEMEK